MAKELLIPVERIEHSILLIRGQKVMLDSDLAGLYGVETFNLNKAVKRNLDRFPADFMFQLSAEEAESLRFQTGISKPAGRGGRRYRPYAFTEQGVAMLSSVLHNKRAVEVNIAIMRAFVRLREILATHKDLARRLDELEKKVGQQDDKIHAVFEAIRQLMSSPPAPKKRRIGFGAVDDESPQANAADRSKRGGTTKRRRHKEIKHRQPSFPVECLSVQSPSRSVVMQARASSDSDARRWADRLRGRLARADYSPARSRRS